MKLHAVPGSDTAFAVMLRGRHDRIGLTVDLIRAGVSFGQQWVWPRHGILPRRRSHCGRCSVDHYGCSVTHCPIFRSVAAGHQAGHKPRHNPAQYSSRASHAPLLSLD